jgi:hypothetical protein
MPSPSGRRVCSKRVRSVRHAQREFRCFWKEGPLLNALVSPFGSACHATLIPKLSSMLSNWLSSNNSLHLWSICIYPFHIFHPYTSTWDNWFEKFNHNRSCYLLSTKTKVPQTFARVFKVRQKQGRRGGGGDGTLGKKTSEPQWCVLKKSWECCSWYFQK